MSRRGQAVAGARFGRLTLIEQVGSSKRHTRWLMKCDCGTEKEISIDSVLGGQVSCGCYRREMVRKKLVGDLVGRRVGMLTVIRYYTCYKGNSLWMCKCDCGCGYIGTHAHLAHGRVKSCGCLIRKFKYAEKSEAQLQKYAQNHTRRARLRGAEGSFKPEDIKRIYKAQRGKCAWCPASLAGGFHKDHRTPLSKGGTNDAGNIELLCGPCNMRKHNKDPIEWAQMNGRLL